MVLVDISVVVQDVWRKVVVFGLRLVVQVALYSIHVAVEFSGRRS